MRYLPLAALPLAAATLGQKLATVVPSGAAT